MRSDAPDAYHACVRCQRGDTPTGFVARGSALWVVELLCDILGLEFTDGDSAAAEAHLDHKFGPIDGPVCEVVRLCRSCATAVGRKVQFIGGDPQGQVLLTYVEEGF